ncbi:MAG: hypothetical protein HY316_03130 [Acidobacteria bacterium]|nr:hypothetical protein [Acidobacteriota bacterium]
MKCPTCGKGLKKGQAVCAFCGALAGEPGSKASATKPGDFHPPSFEEKKTPPVREIATEEHEWPAFETMEEESHPERAPDTPEQSAPAHPKPPAWVRLISPLFFILVFLVTQFWLRDSEPPRSADSQPVLRQAGFSENIPDIQGAGQPASRKTVFSRQENRQIIFFSTWNGSPSGHKYSVVWHSPDGATHRSSQVSAKSLSGGRQFSVIATLLLEPSLPVGQWRVEVSQDGREAGRYTFQLTE